MQDEQTVMEGLLPRAKAGDEDARNRVALYVFKRYKYRIKGLYSVDPAISKEDFEMTFFLAIFKAIPELDHRGNPFYFAGQRGVWAVGSQLRTIKALAKRRSYAEIGESYDDDAYTVNPADPTAEFAATVISRIGDERLIRVIANSPMKSRTRQALDLICAGEVGDPEEEGFNKRLAEKMGISPQRASQVMQDIREQVLREDGWTVTRHKKVVGQPKVPDEWTHVAHDGIFTLDAALAVRESSLNDFQEAAA